MSCVHLGGHAAVVHAYIGAGLNVLLVLSGVSMPTVIQSIQCGLVFVPLSCYLLCSEPAT